jgi:hypothetical protein
MSFEVLAGVDSGLVVGRLASGHVPAFHPSSHRQYLLFDCQPFRRVAKAPSMGVGARRTARSASRRASRARSSAVRSGLGKLACDQPPKRRGILCRVSARTGQQGLDLADRETKLDLQAHCRVKEGTFPYVSHVMSRR